MEAEKGVAFGREQPDASSELKSLLGRLHTNVMAETRCYRNETAGAGGESLGNQGEQIRDSKTGKVKIIS